MQQGSRLGSNMNTNETLRTLLGNINEGNCAYENGCMNQLIRNEGEMGEENRITDKENAVPLHAEKTMRTKSPIGKIR